MTKSLPEGSSIRLFQLACRVSEMIRNAGERKVHLWKG